MPVLSLPEAEQLIIATLIRCRTGGDNARAVAAALIGAELAGQPAHGLRRLPAYAAQAWGGKVDGLARPRPHQILPGVMRIDAGGGFAYPALDLAVEWLTGTAPVQGIAAASVTRSHHCGVAGVTVRRLADAGLVALMFANTPAAMAPWGGNRAVFGTNPIAFAAPRAGTAAPVVVDVSLSKVARGKVMAARQRGEAIPEGWALDAAGQPTTDPAAALAGMMVPLGDAKGTALALMVEALAAGLAGANFGYEASSFLDAAGPPPGTGQLLIAIAPDAFAAAGTDRSPVARIEDLSRVIEDQPGARLPGARRDETAARVIAQGIALDDALMAEIEAVGRG